jgi:hypothetical protein
METIANKGANMNNLSNHVYENFVLGTKYVAKKETQGTKTYIVVYVDGVPVMRAGGNRATRAKYVVLVSYLTSEREDGKFVYSDDRRSAELSCRATLEGAISWKKSHERKDRHGRTEQKLVVSVLPVEEVAS